jgi:oxygen-independent coproporphyrinogen-3 oxidase
LWAGRDDLSRRDVIMALMCHGRVVFRAIKRACPVRERTYFAAEIERLVPFSQERSVGLDNQGIQLTAPGWLFVGGVAMVFDRHLRVDRDHSRPSRIVTRRRLWTLC